MDVLYLGGWSGKDEKDSRMIELYAKAGLDEPEMLKRLWDTAKNAFNWMESK